MNKFRIGDIVIDDYYKKGIVIGYNNPYRHDTVMVLIKTGYYYSTLESSDDNWRYIDHYEEFEDILEELEG